MICLYHLINLDLTFKMNLLRFRYYLDFVLDQVDTHPDEVEFMERSAKIGIGRCQLWKILIYNNC
jgi:hypothetical protein